MNRSRLRTLAIVSGLFASTGIALVLGGLAAVVIAIVRDGGVWIAIGAAAAVLGVIFYVIAQRMARNIAATRRIDG